jgi:hypothetical protein
MAEQSMSPDVTTQIENKSQFLDSTKQQVYEKTALKIERDLLQIDSIEPDKSKRIMQKFGTVFEDLASAEEHQKHPESEKQKQLRELIETVYNEAELIIGTAHERPSKPDGVSVSFDSQGKLIIDEIIEFKSSENAFVHGIDKGQPPKTLETIGRIVNIFNKLLSGEKTVNLKPLDPELSLDKRVKRDVQLQNIQKQITSIVNPGEKVTFSPDMIYKIIVPNGVTIPRFDEKFLEELGYMVKMEISNSVFSRQDIHQVIDSQQK